MTVTRKRVKRLERRRVQRLTPAGLDTPTIIQRIDAMMHELETFRRQLTALPKVTAGLGLTQELFGVAGQGSREEYDVHLDWKRFAEWQLR